MVGQEELLVLLPAGVRHLAPHQVHVPAHSTRCQVQVLASAGAAPVVAVEEVGRLAEVPGLHRHHRHRELGQLQPQHAAEHNVQCAM